MNKSLMKGQFEDLPPRVARPIQSSALSAVCAARVADELHFGLLDEKGLAPVSDGDVR
jgi:hypothetical protein